MGQEKKKNTNNSYIPERRFILCIHQAHKILGFCCCSYAKFCLTLWDAMDFSILGASVPHYSSEFVQIHVIELVLLSNCPIPWHPLFPLPSIFLSIRVFTNELALLIRWPKYWSFSISPCNEYSGLISFRINYFDLLSSPRDSQESFPQHNLKASVLSILIYLHLLVKQILGKLRDLNNVNISNGGKCKIILLWNQGS